MTIETRHYYSCDEGAHSIWRQKLARDSSVIQIDPPLPPPASLVLRYPPRELYVRGKERAFELLRWLPEFGFAVVGTRKPQARSAQLVRDRLQALHGTRLMILSGLALGIDSIAHQAALAADLPTIAILGSPLDSLYPPENRDLAARILDRGGLLVTEFAPGTPIERHFFLLRNRLIAAWAKATWIAEAGFRSGALNTASWAWDHDRDTYATPSFPGDPAHAGNQGLISREKAYAFWEPGDLKKTWKELNRLGRRERSLPMPSLWDSHAYNDGSPISDASLLQIQVTRSTLQQGGASVEILLDWALAQNWNPQRFFDALQLCINDRRIQDHNGTLCSTALRTP